MTIFKNNEKLLIENFKIIIKINIFNKIRDNYRFITVCYRFLKGPPTFYFYVSFFISDLKRYPPMKIFI